MNKSGLLVGRVVREAFFDLGYYIFEFDSLWILTILSPILEVNEDNIQEFIGLKILEVKEVGHSVEIAFTTNKIFRINICRSVQPEAVESMFLKGPAHEMYSWSCKDPK